MLLFGVINYSLGNKKGDYYICNWDFETFLKNCDALAKLVEETPYTQKISLKLIKAYYDDGIENVSSYVTEEELVNLIKYLPKFMEDGLVKVDSIDETEVWGLSEPR